MIPFLLMQTNMIRVVRVSHLFDPLVLLIRVCGFVPLSGCFLHLFFLPIFLVTDVVFIVLSLSLFSFLSLFCFGCYSLYIFSSLCLLQLCNKANKKIVMVFFVCFSLCNFNFPLFFSLGLRCLSLSLLSLSLSLSVSLFLSFSSVSFI